MGSPHCTHSVSPGFWKYRGWFSSRAHISSATTVVPKWDIERDHVGNCTKPVSRQRGCEGGQEGFRSLLPKRGSRVPATGWPRGGSRETLPHRGRPSTAAVSLAQVVLSLREKPHGYSRHTRCLAKCLVHGLVSQPSQQCMRQVVTIL